METIKTKFQKNEIFRYQVASYVAVALKATMVTVTLQTYQLQCNSSPHGTQLLPYSLNCYRRKLYNPRQSHNLNYIHIHDTSSTRSLVPTKGHCSCIHFTVQLYYNYNIAVPQLVPFIYCTTSTYRQLSIRYWFKLLHRRHD